MTGRSSPVVELQSSYFPCEFAEQASTMESARKALSDAGYDIGETPLTRKLDPHSGQGFWDTTVVTTFQNKEFGKDGQPQLTTDSKRMVSYGTGEYVQPHYHDIYEAFDIKKGGCSVWTSQNKGVTWQYNHCGKGPLNIPDGAWHCLEADQEGLCMDITNDAKRSINWLDANNSDKWAPTLSFVVTIHDLRARTIRLLEE